MTYARPITNEIGEPIGIDYIEPDEPEIDLDDYDALTAWVDED